MNESGSLSEGAGAKRLIVARAHRCAVGPHSGREGPTLGRACYPSRGIGSQRWIKQRLSLEAAAMNCPDSLRHRLAAMPPPSEREAFHSKDGRRAYCGTHPMLNMKLLPGETDFVSPGSLFRQAGNTLATIPLTPGSAMVFTGMLPSCPFKPC